MRKEWFRQGPLGKKQSSSQEKSRDKASPHSRFKSTSLFYSKHQTESGAQGQVQGGHGTLLGYYPAHYIQSPFTKSDCPLT